MVQKVKTETYIKNLSDITRNIKSSQTCGCISFIYDTTESRSSRLSVISNCFDRENKDLIYLYYFSLFLFLSIDSIFSIECQRKPSFNPFIFSCFEFTEWWTSISQFSHIVMMSQHDGYYICRFMLKLCVHYRCWVVSFVSSRGKLTVGWRSFEHSLWLQLCTTHVQYETKRNKYENFK